MTGVWRNVYYFFDELSATSRGVVTVRIIGPIRPPPTIIIASPPSLLASEPLSTHPLRLALSLMDRWLAWKMIVIGVMARKERKAGLAPA